MMNIEITRSLSGFGKYTEAIVWAEEWTMAG